MATESLIKLRKSFILSITFVHIAWISFHIGVFPPLISLHIRTVHSETPKYIFYILILQCFIYKWHPKVILYVACTYYLYSHTHPSMQLYAYLHAWMTECMAMHGWVSRWLSMWITECMIACAHRVRIKSFHDSSMAYCILVITMCILNWLRTLLKFQ